MSTDNNFTWNASTNSSFGRGVPSDMFNIENGQHLTGTHFQSSMLNGRQIWPFEGFILVSSKKHIRQRQSVGSQRLSGFGFIADSDCLQSYQFLVQSETYYEGGQGVFLHWTQIQRHNTFFWNFKALLFKSKKSLLSCSRQMTRFLV